MYENGNAKAKCDNGREQGPLITLWMKRIRKTQQRKPPILSTIISIKIRTRIRTSERRPRPSLMRTDLFARSSSWTFTMTWRHLSPSLTGTRTCSSCLKDVRSHKRMAAATQKSWRSWKIRSTMLATSSSIASTRVACMATCVHAPVQLQQLGGRLHRISDFPRSIELVCVSFQTREAHLYGHFELWALREPPFSCSLVHGLEAPHRIAAQEKVNWKMKFENKSKFGLKLVFFFFFVKFV